ncbi:GHMP family kinase ATP-binding protein [Candidatus Laterigemmans baculatus]|uniref:GHMP family kinase ATP-binding protein n=1 Tax=Candidatus Laterigemmans baculatus TaxID=2770505 RepID=UPI0013DC5B3C|nr:beta-ribofuranosylaminobenzene 5'-phosphate synthase [Candidatus Laterigemmans baculatus]
MVQPRSVPHPRSLEITTGARLHLGLLDTAEPFGGVGLMLREPATRIRIQEATEFEARGAAGDRVKEVARRFAAYWRLEELPRCAIEVLRRPPPHAGLGSGTQLAMAVAEGLCHFTGREVIARESDSESLDESPRESDRIERSTLAVEIAGRGRRSAVGAHGYFDGGLIYEAAAAVAARLNPVRARVELPESWRVLLVRNRGAAPEVAGEAELAHFARLPPVAEQVREQLRREVEEELLPAAVAGDFERWSQAVHRYNRESGNLFAAVQGGPYNGAVIAAWVERLRGLGVRGVGQSSWGPAVFAFCRSHAEAEEIRSRIASQYGDAAEMTLARFASRGRELRDAPAEHVDSRYN